MQTLQEELLTSLDASWEHISTLFELVAQHTALEQGAVASDARARLDEHAAALERMDRELARKLETAARHQEIQRELEPLVARIQERDARLRSVVARVAAMRTELYGLLAPAEEECKRIAQAEQDPLDWREVLEYAQRLARFTSAPPGYRLGAGDGAPGAREYNPNAERAAGYYDPAIPSMRQELPFPSDMLMRQGILYADAAAEGTAATMPVEEGAAPAAAPAAQAEEPAHPPSPPPHTLDAFAGEEEEPFDLDLNP